MALSLKDYLAWLQTAGTVPVKPETSAGETAEGADPAAGDLSSGGRISLDAALADPTSLANLTLNTMGFLAGPIGSLAMRGGKAAMAAHNNAELTAQLRAEQGPRFALQRQDEAASQGVPAQGLNPADVDIATEAEQGDTGISASDAAAAAAAGVAGNTGVGIGEGPAGESGGVSGTAYERGGVVQDRRPGLAEPITAHQGEYVVMAKHAKKYHRLLEAINAGESPRKLTSLLKAMTT